MRSQHTISLVFGFRNRDSVRVRRCLESLSNQTHVDFSVCFVDYGSDEQVRNEIKILVEQFSFCKYVFVPTQGKFWNRAHALNIGVRESEPSEFILTTDVDLIFPPNFMERLIGALDIGKEIHFSARDLPRTFDRWAKLHDGEIYGESRPNTALGLAQAVHRSKFEAIGGFDEFYCIWGVEDEDLSQRLSLSGVKTQWLSYDDCILYHQWHPTSGRRNFNLPGRWQEYLVKYKDGNSSLVRNNGNWGRFRLDRRLSSNFDLSGFEQYDLNRVPAQLVSSQISQIVSQMQIGEITTFVFKDLLLDQLSQSRLMRLIRKINHFLDLRNSGLMLTNDLSYYKRYQSVFDYRDAVAYYILYNRSSFQDYYFFMESGKLQLVVMK